MAIMLAGCDRVEEERAEVASQVPAAIQEMIAADFPADGEIHVQSRGQFEIRPETLICEMDSVVDSSMVGMGITGLGLDGGLVSQWLETLGQPAYLDGSSRQRTVSGGHCPAVEENIVYLGHVLNNRGGTPYKLRLAVWQGDPEADGAVWIGGLERLGDLPDLPPPVDIMPAGEVVATADEIEAAEFRETVRWNIARDANALSRNFREFIR